MAKVFALVTDLFFATRIQDTARALGIPLETISSGSALLERCRAERPALVIVDLNATAAQPVETVAQLKADDGLRLVPVVAYLSHVQVDLERAAREAGCDMVLPRSKFTHQLPDLLRRHAGDAKGTQ